MNRFEVRVWDTINKEFIDNEYFRITGNGNVENFRNEMENDTNCVITQFTGLCDKNGSKIYEGDIVTYDRGVGNWTGKRMSTTHTIVFSEEVFAFVMDYGSSYIKLRKHWNYIYEVIGNIHENPELLSTPTAVL